jgi:hypothetical protein
MLDIVGVQFAVLLWFLLLVVAMVGGRMAAGSAQVARWLALTVLTLMAGFLVAFLGVHALLFTLGTGAATLGLVAALVFIEATPIAWAIVLRRGHHPSAG